MSSCVVAALVLLLAASGARAATLERVALEPSDPPVVRLQLDAPVTVRSQQIPPRDGLPARIVLDLPGTRLGGGARGLTGVGELQRVRLGQFDADTVRVVLDLAAPVGFDVTNDGARIEVRLRQAAPVAPVAPALPGRTKPSTPYLDYDADEIQPLPTLP